MAVDHCRCAFLWFFLLHKQKKEHKTLYFRDIFFNNMVTRFTEKHRDQLFSLIRGNIFT